jgi:tRNA(Ile)-lysidine synthase
MLEQVRAQGLLAAGRGVVVLFSGGRDSTCLLDLAVRICGRDAVCALHLNYGLRDAADADEQHCALICERLGVALQTRRPQRPESGNLQAWARDVRYSAAAAIALERGADVAAGHTATDQVETVLYRLASSPSRRALLGMRERQGLLIRPLLRFTREQTAAYCAQRGLTWREDESNRSAAFARNRVRAGMVPALREVHPAAEDNVLALIELLRDEAEVLDALVGQTLSGAASISVARLRALPIALRRLVVQRLADDAAGEPAPGAGRRADEIAALDDRGTSELDIGGGVRVVAEYGIVRFERRRRGAVVSPEPVRLPIPGVVEFAGHRVSCELGPPVLGPGVLDRATLGSELLVRAWRPGDRMRPLGLHGSKSLQDLFTARRVPRRERASVAVVESGGEIAWVPGVATSERFKVTARTTETVRLTSARAKPTGTRSVPIE